MKLGDYLIAFSVSLIFLGIVLAGWNKWWGAGVCLLGSGVAVLAQWVVAR